MVLESHAHGDTRATIDNEPHGSRDAESIVKNTVLEAHAHGDTPARSHNEPGG